MEAGTLLVKIVRVEVGVEYSAQRFAGCRKEGWAYMRNFPAAEEQWLERAEEESDELQGSSLSFCCAPDVGRLSKQGETCRAARAKDLAGNEAWRRCAWAENLTEFHGGRAGSQDDAASEGPSSHQAPEFHAARPPHLQPHRHRHHRHLVCRQNPQVLCVRGRLHTVRIVSVCYIVARSFKLLVHS